MTMNLQPELNLTPERLVEHYLSNNFRCCFWPATGDLKGPQEPGWPHKHYTIADYHDGYRVGLLTGHAIAPGKYLVDIDIDWSEGAMIAMRLLPPTGFVYGRQSKQFSHCFYTVPSPLTSYKFEDIDGTTLLEIRGVKANGEVGFQSMAPPSVWSKDGRQEPLRFVKGVYETPTHVETTEELKSRATLTAIGMLLARHLGVRGFNHDGRVCVAGFLLRAGISAEDIIRIGEAILPITGNKDTQDVRRSVQSTADSLKIPGAKVKGGPALAKMIGERGKAVINKINEWLGREQDFVRTQDGAIVAKHQGNILRAIEQMGHELTFNEFSAQMLIDNAPLEDPQWKALYLAIDEDYRFQPPVDYFRMVIENACWQHRFHPVKKYLDEQVWDGKPRIDTWLIRCAEAEDTPYVRAISSIMLIAAVRRIRQPGCKYDEMVVWESHQGAEKSSAAAALCPDPEWFSDDLRLNLQSQELIEATLGKWIIEASDLAGKRKTEVEQLKAMLSRQKDGPARMAYAHFPIERPRQFILIGTTNSSTYLVDSTGSRRFWPVRIGRFNVELIKRYRDQMWAEACHREAQGESIRLHPALWPAATIQQEKRREIDPWEQTLRQFVSGISKENDGLRRVATVLLWEQLNLPVERRDHLAARRMSDIMTRLGFRRTTKRVGGGPPQASYIECDPANEIELLEED